MPNKPTMLTPEGRVKLEEELQHLIEVRRPQVAKHLKAAIEEGDLRENAGYSEAKREQALLEGRIAEVQAILKNAVEIKNNGRNGKVTFGSQVTIAEAGYDHETYLIVSPPEADPLKGRISDESPLGRALMGHRVGDTVEASTPAGTVTLEIVSID